MNDKDFKRIRGSGASPYNPASQPEASVHAVGRESVRQARGNLMTFGKPWNHGRVDQTPEEIAERHRKIREAQAKTYGTKIDILEQASKLTTPNALPEGKEPSSTAKGILGEAAVRGMLASPDHWSFESFREELETEDPPELPAHLQAKLDKARATGDLTRVVRAQREIATELLTMEKGLVKEDGAVNDDAEFWAKMKPVDVEAIDYEEEK